MKNITAALNAYLGCALWSDGSFDDKSISDIGESSKATALADITKFVEMAGDLLDGLISEEVGHDFWLTRNHHGSGFWDRYDGELGKKLTEIAHTFKELNLWKSECDVIYFE
jgi:hypothetical protein